MSEKSIDIDTYLNLREEGINIGTGELDLHAVSVGCEDLSRYRKAFRVKIRALLKEDDFAGLERQMNALYALGQFARYLYGFHSCNTPVDPWQEKLALHLQKAFDASMIKSYSEEEWIRYDAEALSGDIDQKAREYLHPDEINGACLQDRKPFLNPKDRSHFNTVLQGLQKSKESHV